MSSINHHTCPIVAAYMGIFEENWDDRFRKDTPLDKLTRLNIAFAKIIKDSNRHSNRHFTCAIKETEKERARQLIDRVKKVNPAAEIFISVQEEGDKFISASKDPAFFQNTVKFMQEYGFTGFDIDWELDLEKDSLNNLIKGLSDVFQPNGFKLTLAGWDNPDDEYDMEVLKQYLDQINIMSYGPNDDLGLSVQLYVEAGFPGEKLIGGIDTEVPHKKGQAIDKVDTIESIRKKAEFALTYPIAGMMSWRLDNDYTTKENPEYPTYKGALELWSTCKKKEPDNYVIKKDPLAVL